MKVGEEKQVFDLVMAGFHEYVLPDMTEEGKIEFIRAAREFIYERPAAHFILVAESKNDIIGMIDIKGNNHICLFFIASEFHRKAIGRYLLRQAKAACIANDPNIIELDVNSSLFAVPIYERLGFSQTMSEQFVNGIRFVPMSKEIREW